MAMTSSLLSTNVLVCYHVVQNSVARMCVLQPLSAHTEVQLQSLLFQFETLLLLLVDVQLGHRAPMPHNLCLQSLITNASYCGVNCVGHRVVVIEHAQCMVRDVLDRFIIIGCRMQLGTVVSASERKLTYYVRISCHVDLNVAGRCRDSMFIGDGKGDKVHPNVVDKSLRGFDWYPCLGCCCTCVSRGGRWLY